MTLKSALLHSTTFDFALPSIGSTLAVGVQNELAGMGLGGSSHFFRDKGLFHSILVRMTTCLQCKRGW